MAQELNFTSGDRKFNLNPKKVERSKVYGLIEKVVLDDNGQACKTVTMDDSGTIIIPKGGAGLGMLDANFNWVERAQLVAVNDDGEIVKKMPSSFSNPIPLDTKVSVETFLDHSITVVYQLEGDYAELIQFLGNDIYSFMFNYRESYEASPAFLLANSEGLFMLVGSKNEFEFVGLQELSLLDAEDDEETETDDFDIDFSFN